VITQRDHLDAICVVLEQRLESAPPVTARRLLRPQLRWVEQQLADGGGVELAERLGVVELVESCRDEHLASLDADDGLAALQIDWEDVVIHACARGADNAARRCARCNAPARSTTRRRCPVCGSSLPRR
jgi:hypothetical protein